MTQTLCEQGWQRLQHGEGIAGPKLDLRVSLSGSATVPTARLLSLESVSERFFASINSSAYSSPL